MAATVPSAAATTEKDESEGSDDEIEDIIDKEEDPRAKQLLKQSVQWLQKDKSNDVECEYLIGFLDRQIRESRTCRKFPLTVFFFVSFAVTVFLHEDIPVTSSLARHTRLMLEGTTFDGVPKTSGHKDIADIGDLQEIYQYIEDVVLPLFLPANRTNVLETGGLTELTRTMRYSRLIGGLQMQQKRRKVRNCDSVFPIVSFEDFGCYPTNNAGDFTDDCYGPLAFGRRSLGDRMQMPSGFCGDTTPEGLYESQNYSRFLMQGASVDHADFTENVNLTDAADLRRLRMAGRKRAKPSAKGGMGYIPNLNYPNAPTYSAMFSSALGQVESLKRLNWLREHAWIDEQTQWLGIMAFVFNPDLGTYGHATINFYFGLGGEVFPIVEMQTFIAEPYQHKSIIAADVIYMSFVLVLFVRTTCNVCVRLFTMKVSAALKKPWLWVDLALVYGGFVMLTMYAFGFVYLQDVKDKAVAESAWTLASGVTLDNLPNAMDPDDPEYLKRLLALHKAGSDFASYLGFYRGIMSIYSIVCIIGFFQGFQMQPRLAMITNTLFYASIELTHHALIVFIFLLAFSASGTFLFGRRVFAYSSYDLALLSPAWTTLFGDSDWEKRTEDNFWTAMAWLILFLFIMNLMLVNMFMAIVMDVYGQVKGQALARQPIWEQLADWIRMYRVSRDWVSLSVLSRVVRQFLWNEGVERATPDMIQKLVPGMSEAQADVLVQRARRARDAEDDESMTMTQFLQLIGHIAVDVGSIGDQLLSGWDEGSLGQVKEYLKKMAEEAAKAVKPEMSETPQHPEKKMEPVAEEFREKVSQISQRLDSIQLFMEQSMTWATYRSRQTHAELSRIETLTSTKTNELTRRSNTPQAAPVGVLAVVDDEEPTPPTLLPRAP
jgi:hypothetical protein